MSLPSVSVLFINLMSRLALTSRPFGLTVAHHAPTKKCSSPCMTVISSVIHTTIGDQVRQDNLKVRVLAPAFMCHSCIFVVLIPTCQDKPQHAESSNRRRKRHEDTPEDNWTSDPSDTDSDADTDADEIINTDLSWSNIDSGDGEHDD